jgi:DNA polymerase-3 subunit epsilon
MNGLRLRRLAYRRRVRGTPLAACWEHPGPHWRTRFVEASLLAVDGEMSSLLPSEGELISLGWVPIDAARVLLGESRHALIRAAGTVGQSATIHQLRDCELAAGANLAAVMDAFLAAAAGRVLVFHHAPLDLAFLDKCCRTLYGAPLLLPVIDTLRIERLRMARRNQHAGPGELTLQACRRRYQLPLYPVHNALVDAVATAELLLAQARHKGAPGRLRLRALR